MKFSIIIPSYNQPDYIERTFLNLVHLKELAAKYSIEVELLLFDSCSGIKVQKIIEKYESIFDFIEIAKDKGQYDAINNGIVKSTGDYWTWLNTDDLIVPESFFKIVKILSDNSAIDYIYGSIDIINENDALIKSVASYDLSVDHLLNINPSIFQPGSFFKKSFTNKIGLLEDNNCCFDYEYVLRLFTNNAQFYRCDFVLAKFRYYTNSKSGSSTPVFIKEQLKISKKYGRRNLSFMTIFLNLRLFKHFLFPR